MAARVEPGPVVAERVDTGQVVAEPQPEGGEGPEDAGVPLYRAGTLPAPLHT